MPYVNPVTSQAPPTTSTPPPLPPNQPASVTESPPASPVSSFPAASDDEMSDSWLEVEERSSVGPSVISDAAFSDTSSDSHDHDNDHQSRWSRESNDGREDSDIEDDGAVIIEPSSTGLSPSLAGGEYTDAEASTSKLGSSVGTIQHGLASTSSSQIRLIFPDPGASFSTSSGTLSMGHTPSASISGLTPLPQPDQSIRRRAGTNVDHPETPPSIMSAKLSSRRSSSPVRRGVDDSWLRSSRLWEPPKEIIRSAINEGYEYRLLTSTDDVERTENEVIMPEDAGLKMPKVDVGEDVAKEAVNFPELDKVELKEKTFPVAFDGDDDHRDPLLEQLELHRALRTDNVAQIKASAKKWSTRVSLLTLASLVSLALFRTFGPNFSLSSGQQSTVTPVQQAEPPANVNRPASFWDNLPFSDLFVPSFAPSSASASPATTPAHPDLQVIKQALSTLSTIQDKISSVAAKASTTDSTKATQEAPVQPKDANIRSSTSCCSVSIRNDQLALTVPMRQPDTHLTVAQKLTQKILGPNTSAPPAIETTTAAHSNCTCSLSTAVQSEVLARVAAAFSTTRGYALSTSTYLSHLFGPIIASLENELGDIFSLARSVASSASSSSQAAVSKAAKGAANLSALVNTGLRRCTDRLSTLFTSSSTSTKDDSLARAQAVLDSVSEYVDARLDGLSELIEEQTEVMHEKAWDSINKAKKGLNRLIRDAERLRSGEQPKPVTTDVEKDGPMPFARMGHLPARPGRQACFRMGRGTRRRERGKRRGTEQRKNGPVVMVTPLPPPEKPSRARRMLDAVHHGAMALVI